MNMTSNETSFLLSFLQPQYNVLEYGSGESTITISSKVDSLTSLEHDKIWYDNISKRIPNNANLIFVPPDVGISVPEDGNLLQFHNYIFAPYEYGPFDFIFIDGRARRDCAWSTKYMIKTNGLIAIHDFGSQPNDTKDSRFDYYDVLQWMDIVDSNERLFIFRWKQFSDLDKMFRKTYIDCED